MPALSFFQTSFRQHFTFKVSFFHEEKPSLKIRILVDPSFKTRPFSDQCFMGKFGCYDMPSNIRTDNGQPTPGQLFNQ